MEPVCFISRPRCTFSHSPHFWVLHWDQTQITTMLKDTYNVRQLMIIFCFYFSWLRVYSQKLQTSCCKECWRLNTPESTPRLQLHWNTPYKGKNHKVFEVTRQKFKSSPVGISYNFYLTVGGSDIDLLTSWNRRCRSSFDHHHIFIQCTCYTKQKKQNNLQ